MATKTTTAADYRRRMTRVVDFLHQNLDTNIRIDDLADIAHLSPYHWHRIYTAMQGETVANTLKRLRLERAADSLANSSTGIRTIAQKAQYSTPEAFGRAFKSAYGMTPAAYRDRGSHNEFKNANLVGDYARFEVNIEALGFSDCAVVPHTGSYMQINHAMGVLFGALAEQQLLDENSAMLAVFYDDPELTAEAKLRSAACSPVGAGVTLAPPLEMTTLYQADYAKLLYTGPYADMKDAYQWLYGTWLPNSGQTVADAPAVECYLDNPQDTPPNKLRTLLCLPLESDR
jgi:AraC family transcriptional regulator